MLASMFLHLYSGNRSAMAETPTPVGNTTAAADADADAPAQAVPHKAKLLNVKVLK